MIDFKQTYNDLISDDLESRKNGVASLYKEYRTLFHRRLKRKNPDIDEQDIEDLVQDGFLEIIKKSSRPRNQYSIAGWAWKFIIHKASNFGKKFSVKNEGKYDPEKLNIIISEIEKNNSSSKTNTPLFLNCCYQVVFNFIEKHRDYYEIWEEFVLTSLSQQQLTEKFGKTLSNIKKICSTTQEDLKNLVKPCRDNA